VDQRPGPVPEDHALDDDAEPTVAESDEVVEVVEADAEAEVAVVAPPRKLVWVGIVAAVTLVLDQLTKTWALRNLADGPRHVIGDLDLALAYNKGAAFSMGNGRGLGPWITVLALVVIVALALGYTSRFRLGATAAGLIAGGALGNLADRAFRGDDGFLHGAVVDWIALTWWPTFNIADAGICVGAVLLVIATFLAPAP
jgi:signal peptidase II